MKLINWIVLAVLAALSIIFVALYFALGFDQVDWPQGLVLGIIWWAAIIGVGVAISLQQRHYSKQDIGTGNASASRTSGPSKTSVSKNKPAANAVITAILVPALVLCPYFASNVSYADESSSSAAQTATALSEDQSEHAETADSDNADNWYYKLSPESTGIYLFYSVRNSPLKQLEPGQVLGVPHTYAVEFYVRPKAGYLTGSTFTHSGNANDFVTPNSKGVYSKIGTNELSGFQDATNQALEYGCTKEFHYSFNSNSNWENYRYREFDITIKPFPIRASFELNGGTIDGSSTYLDNNTYYGTNVENHSDDNIIQLPSESPEKENYEFTGWKVGNSDALIPAGSQVNIENYWRYLYDNSNDTSASLPISAQWKEAEVDTSAPDAGTTAPIAPGSGNESSDSSSASSSDASQGTSVSDASSSEGSSASSSDSSTDNPSSSNGAAAPGGTDSSNSSDDKTDDGNLGELAGSGDASSDKQPNDNGTQNPSGDSSSNTSPSVSDGNTSGLAATQGSQGASITPNASATNDAAVSEMDNPLSGDVAHGLKLASQQRTAGTIDDNMPFSKAITSGSNAMRDGIYMVEDLIIDDPVALGYGISYANRGCWICDYLKAGIIITLLYGAIVVVYRAARRNRSESNMTGEAVGAQAA